MGHAGLPLHSWHLSYSTTLAQCHQLSLASQLAASRRGPWEVHTAHHSRKTPWTPHPPNPPPRAGRWSCRAPAAAAASSSLASATPPTPTCAVIAPYAANLRAAAGSQSTSRRRYSAGRRCWCAAEVLCRCERAGRALLCRQPNKHPSLSQHTAPPRTPCDSRSALLPRGPLPAGQLAQGAQRGGALQAYRMLLPGESGGALQVRRDGRARRRRMQRQTLSGQRCMPLHCRMAPEVACLTLTNSPLAAPSTHLQPSTNSRFFCRDCGTYLWARDPQWDQVRLQNPPLPAQTHLSVRCMRSASLLTTSLVN